MSATLLRAENVTARLGGRDVLRGISLSLTAGEIVALIGPNGSGKSTCIRALLGLIRSRGEITWDDKPLVNWNRRALARRVAYLPQSPMHEPGQTVREVLRMGRSPYWAGFGLEGKKDAALVDQTLAQLRLDDRPMETLSGGQRQRVYVGRCLVQEPAAMLLDEPDTFLDLSHTVALHRDLRKLVREKSIGILMTSHDLNAAAALADRLYLLKEGDVAASGSADQVMQAETVSRVFGVSLERIDRANQAPLLVPISDVSAPISKVH